MKKKSCGKCGVRQSLLDEFYKDVTNPTGRGSYCKKCSFKPRVKIIVDIARVKELQAIFKVPVNVLKTQAAYMGQKHRETQKQINIR